MAPVFWEKNMNRRAAGVAFIALAAVLYGFAPAAFRYGDGEAPMLLLVMLGVGYLYMAETGKPTP